MALDAIIFDIDGTLVDSNPAHVEAWRRVFEAHGYKIATDRIETEVGKGGDKLVPAVIGTSAADRDGDALRQAQPKEFARIANDRGLKPFAGAIDLLSALRRRGLQVVLATSSNREQVHILQQAANLDLEKSADALVTADDARESKPAPDIVAAAVKRTGLSPAQCAMIGDTLYDMQAAHHAGVTGLGVLTGYQSRETLMAAGARGVWADVAEVARQLNDVLTLASPTTIHLTHDALRSLMEEALAQAEAGMRAGEAPIGCVIADGAGRVVARAHNEQNKTGNRTAHAEIVAFAREAGRVPPGRKDLILVSTLEPCVMCTGAAMEAGVDTVVYALRAPADSGTGRVQPPTSPEAQMPRIVGDVLPDRSRALFQRFLESPRDPAQRAYVEQLLKLA